ncbi:MAG: sensor histidine kinase, partial [Atribacterota bacterium]|nr:sensor histidine kinase [Atribacterota bacterium]
LAYQNSSNLRWMLGWQFLWLLLVLIEQFITRKGQKYFLIYIIVQTFIVLTLLSLPGSPDFFATLFIVLSIQVLLRFKLLYGLVWIGFCALSIVLILFKDFQEQAIALSLVYTAGNILLGFYALTTRRAQEADVQNQVLAKQLQEANQQLQSYTRQLENLAVLKERNRLARDMHDSITQTAFSMSLAAQSASLLLNSNPSLVKEQLQRLSQLTQSALSEMKLLISEFPLVQVTPGELVTALHQHIANRRFSKELTISFQAEGDCILQPAEEQVLFHIAQEALNNAEKHAQASWVNIRLHLQEPVWMDIIDNGKGFDLQSALISGGVGLNSMYERTVEIGWRMEITTAINQGTHLRIEKLKS